MLVARTVKIPVHYGITTHKLSILDSLTARTAYGVSVWSKLFKWATNPLHPRRMRETGDPIGSTG
jgi:hypothetical protein